MTRLLWGEAGSRLYEAGADQVVFYVDDNPGVAWPGVRAIRESPFGGTPSSFYLDGVNFSNISSNENFIASIQAFSSPKEFDVCDGTAALYYGLYVDQQPRKPFNFVYKTKVGNDIDGLDYGYKIHLIYNAIASPTPQENLSLSATVNVIDFLWNIVATPVEFPGIKPTSHFIVDSLLSGPDLMSALEDYLYGTNVTDGLFPSPTELTELFYDYGLLQIMDLGLGLYSAKGLPVQIDGPATFTIDHPSVVDNDDQSFTITY